MLTEKQKYFHLVAETCEKVGAGAVDTAVRAGHPTPTNTLANVRIGRKISLPDLVLLIELAHPEIEIPAHLRPAA